MYEYDTILGVVTSMYASTPVTSSKLSCEPQHRETLRWRQKARSRIVICNTYNNASSRVVDWSQALAIVLLLRVYDPVIVRILPLC